MIALSILVFVLLSCQLALIQKKDYWLVLLILFTVNYFFYIVPPQAVHIEGVGKVSDVGLLIAVVYPLVTPRFRQKLSTIGRTPIAKVILFLGLIVVVTVFTTQLRYGGPLQLTLRLSRDYFFYFAFFIFAAILMNERDLRKLPPRFLVLMLILSVAYILQTILPPETLLYNAALTGITSFGGFVQNRLYLGYLEMYAGLMVLIGILYLVLEKKHKLFALLASLVFLVQVILTQHRNLWVTVIIGTIVALVMLKKTRAGSMKRTFLRLGLLLAAVVSVTIATGLSDYVVDRAVEALADTPLTGGTFTGRLIASENYLTLLSDNMLAGVGLIHPAGGVLGTTDETEYISELGSISLLFHFGVLSVIWLVALSIIYHKLVRSLIRQPHILTEEKAIAIGGHGFFFGTLFMSFLNGGLTMPGGIVLFALVFAYAQALKFSLAKRDRQVSCA